MTAAASLSREGREREQPNVIALPVKPGKGRATQPQKSFDVFTTRLTSP